jgi:hypothetical protein
MKILLLDRVCTRCGHTGEFYPDKSKKDGIHSICVACHKTYQKNLHARDSEARNRQLERSKKYRELNPEKYKLGIRNATLKKKYGITIEEYNSMLATQNNQCAVCFDAPKHQRLHVDHNHKTGKVRGLLCQACNVSIGKMKESPELLRRLALYIEE